MTNSHRPLPVTNDLLLYCDYQEIADQLRSEPAYKKSNKNARTLVRGDGLTIVVTVLKAETELKEHHSPGPATALVLEGAIRFSCLKPDREFQLSQSQSVVFSSQIQHSVKALQDTILVVTFGCKACE